MAKGRTPTVALQGRTQMGRWRIGIIGGSGLYQIDGLAQGRWESLRSPWGEPSDAVYRGEIGEVELVFLPRHGRGHRLSPTTVNYRANIDALKRAGCTDLVSVSACGSLREGVDPGDFVLVDQFIDRTTLREPSFFGTGMVAHVSMAHPVCPRLATLLAEEAEAMGVRTHRGGVYVAIEGPQFSTQAESRMYQSWGGSVIGMTNLPEARLAREAELPYATVAMVTDHDSWREGEEPVSVTEVVRVLQGNAERARVLVRKLAERLSGVERTPDPLGTDHCLDHAIITSPDAIDPTLAARLDAIAGRVLDRGR
jgi:5'-methylthioadenosine phosphorylase